MEVKNPISFDEQINKLKSRGCIIPDDNFAKMQLKRINYYRLTAYFLPFKNEDGTYKDNTSFETVFRIYEFDRKLRKLLFSIIEQIELMLRTEIAYFHSMKYGALGYENADNFNKKHNHERMLQKISDNIRQGNSQPFVKHHIDKYNSKFPLWVIIELFSTGEISFFYADMIAADKKKFAKSYFNTTHYNLTSWLHCLTVLRNYCAHYSRLYYTQFSIVPATPEDINHKLGNRIFDYILVLKFLYPDAIEWKNVYLNELYALIEEYNNVIDMRCIGFPDNWKELLEATNPTIGNK
ncbi:MAG: Abi family protein [Ruminococcus sp.]|nr:Abi family protein [Ruminococcus sp.]